MEALISMISGRLLGVTVVGILAFLLWFSIDIYMFLTRRHFGKVNIYRVHFTRHDHGRTGKKPGALQMRIRNYQVPLGRLYGNRFLFWRVILAALQTTPKNRVVDFGEHAYVTLAPLRGLILEGNRGAEEKRSQGLPFRESRCQIVMVNDRSEDQRDKRSRILRVLIIDQKDLHNIDYYLENPPNVGDIKMFEEVARAFKKKPGAFLHVQMVAA